VVRWSNQPPEAGRLRQLTRQTYDNKPEDHSTTDASTR
jgi:hypothetical protein